MTGGLLNIIAYGNQNIILNGNPSKTFFKTVYSKYTNFGLQKYRIDYKGNQNLQSMQSSKFTFKIPRYAELLLDTFLVITIPDIWSGYYNKENKTQPYKFNWIKHLGCIMIENVILSAGGQILQQFSGEYIKNSMERNLSHSKKEHFYKMIGHEVDLYAPQDSYGRTGYYPNVIQTNSEPSIQGRKLFIPLPFWFSNSSKVAFPLTCLQYNELVIDVILRPIQQLFTINTNEVENRKVTRVSPNFTIPNQQLYNFIQQQNEVLDDTLIDWRSDVHLMATYAFLSEEETKVFTSNEQLYLIKDVYQENFLNVIGNNRLKIKSNYLVSNWFWFLRRTDVKNRNEWSNYTNWEYYNTPNVRPYTYNKRLVGLPAMSTVNNIKSILVKVSFNIDGKFRENEFSSDVYNYIEKFTRCNGCSDDGVYTYSFSLNTDPYELQPSGAMNLNRFKDIYMDILTIYPETNENAQVKTICDNEGNIIGVIDVDPNSLYKYSYDLILFEERFNVVKIMSGNVGLVYSR